MDLDGQRASLLSQGAGAPQDVSEVSDSEGQVARIERDPSYPGAKRVYVYPPTSEGPNHTRWILPAASARPTFYPPDFPFIRDIACRVSVGEGLVFAIWRDEAKRRPDPESAASTLAPMPAVMSDLVSSMKDTLAKIKQTGPEAAEASKALLDRFLQDDVQQLMERASTEEALDDRWAAGFREVRRQSIESGWVVEAAEADGTTPPAVASASFRKAGRQRVVLLTAMFGRGGLSLVEERVESVASS